MDTMNYRGDNEQTIRENNVQLKRVSIVPEAEIKRLNRDEIGIKSDLKGAQIKEYVDRAIYKLIYADMRKITLKSIGK